MREKTLNDLRHYSTFGFYPHDNEGAQELIHFFQDNTAARPSMMEEISVSFTTFHSKKIQLWDGCDNKNIEEAKDDEFFVESKNESFTDTRLSGRMSWQIDNTKKNSRKENILKKFKNYPKLHIQIGSYTNNGKLVALFDMPFHKTNIEKDLVEKSEQSSRTIKLNYKSLDTPEAIKNVHCNYIDLERAKSICSSGYYKFLEKIEAETKKQDQEMDQNAISLDEYERLTDTERMLI